MTETGGALLLVQADADPAHEREWNRWYNGKHVPDLLGLPGFLRGGRFENARPGYGVGVRGPLQRYLAFYDLASAETLKTPEYVRHTQPPGRSDEDTAMYGLFRHTNRAVLELIGEWAVDGFDATTALCLLAVGLVPEPTYEEEYNAWYDTEHIPLLLPVPGVLRARRFRAVEGEPKYLALYDLTSPHVRFSDAFEQAIDTPWSTRMRAHCERRLTGVFQPVAPA